MDERDTTAVIDRALEHGAVTATDPLTRELEQLALALAAEAPTPEPTFAAGLDERVRAGFPRARGRSTRLLGAIPRVRIRRPPAALLAGAASVVAVLAVVVALGGEEGSSSDRAALDAGNAGQEAGGGGTLAAPGAGTRTDPRGDSVTGPAIDLAIRPREQYLRAAPGSALPPTGRRGFVPGERERRIERSATLTLAVPVARLDRAATEVVAVTDRHDGFVLRSTLTTGDEGIATGGDFELRIPARRLQPALDDLAKLGQVRARTQSGNDVTSAFVTTGDRLEATRAERQGLLRRLEQADTDVEAEALRLQLDANAGQINRLRGRIRALRIRTDYANVGLTLTSRDDEGASAPGDGVGGALDDATETLGESLELAIRALGALIPLGLLALTAVVAVRAVLRRRREAALS
jgi:hypothetical protein